MRRWLWLLPLALVAGRAEIDIEFDWTRPRGENLLVNGSLESLTDGLPTGWKWSTAKPENFTVGPDPDAAEGARSFRVDNFTGKMSGYLQQQVTLTPGTEYLLSCRLKPSGGSHLLWVAAGSGEQRLDARAYVIAGSDEYLAPVFLDPRWLVGLNPGRWSPLLLRFRAFENLPETNLSIGNYFAPGTGRYDDLVLTELPGELVCRVTSDADLAAVQVLDHTLYTRWADSPTLGDVIAELKDAPPGTRDWSAPVTTAGGSLRFVVRARTIDGAERTMIWPDGEEAGR